MEEDRPPEGGWYHEDRLVAVLHDRMYPKLHPLDGAHAMYHWRLKAADGSRFEVIAFNDPPVAPCWAIRMGEDHYSVGLDWKDARPVADSFKHTSLVPDAVDVNVDRSHMGQTAAFLADLIANADLVCEPEEHHHVHNPQRLTPIIGGKSTVTTFDGREIIGTDLIYHNIPTGWPNVN